MGVGANSSGNKSLNDRKERAAGRQNEAGAEAEAIKDFNGDDVGNSVGGAFGKEGHPDRDQASANGEGGGGGGGSPGSDLQDVNASGKRARNQNP